MDLPPELWLGIMRGAGYERTPEISKSLREYYPKEYGDYPISSKEIEKATKRASAVYLLQYISKDNAMYLFQLVRSVETGKLIRIRE